MDSNNRNEVFEAALGEAMEMLDCDDTGTMGVRSALKQAASDHGIDYGNPMAVFVLWAERRMGL